MARHKRCWDLNQDIEHPAHRLAALVRKPGASARLPPGLEPLGDVGRQYLKIVTTSTRSVRHEMRRLVFLVELFGAGATASAMDEVMRSGHIGAEYVEYVLRHRRGLKPSTEPLLLGDPSLDGLYFAEPDMSLYDQMVKPQMTREPAQPGSGDKDEDLS